MAPPKKTHCINGHPRVAGNVSKARNCIQCQTERLPKYKESRDRANNSFQDKARKTLSDHYINQLIRAKTGLRVHEITEDDRVEHRRRVIEYRAIKEAKRGENSRDMANGRRDHSRGRGQHRVLPELQSRL